MPAEVTLSQRRRLAENLAHVREQIAAAAARSGRRADEVTLVAVTKYAGPEIARALYDLGCTDLGESRPQELWRKAEALADASVHWHLIGHLQRNKIRRTLPLLTRLHSVDRLSLLADLDSEAAQLGQPVACLLEVNISGEPAKHGFAPTEVAAACEAIQAYPHLQLRGLMGMSGLDSDDAARRKQFALLRSLRDQHRDAFYHSEGELSIGMTDDFPLAIEEGATIVRVGSALLEGVVGD